MKVMLVHNRYQQRGGEDAVFEAEEALLRKNGIEVKTYVVDNARINEQSRLKTAVDTIWSLDSYRRLYREIKAFQPDIVHFHNTFPLISPSGYDACRAHGVPIVQTLHNYRLFCAQGLCFRNDNVCTDCLGKWLPIPAIRHKCYRSSRIETFGLATMLVVHRTLRTWARKVDTFIALTEFSRELLVRSGLPADRIVIKPNFLSCDPGIGNHTGEYFLFVGRLAPEKGITTLLDAWSHMGESAPPLLIAGDGPLVTKAQSAAARLPRVKLLGRRSQQEVHTLMREAAALVIPSLGYEGFPVTLVEGFATGTPVIASDNGSLASVIDEGRNGLLFKTGNSKELADRVRWLTANKTKAVEIGRNARRDFERAYSAEAGLRQILAVYKQTLEGQSR